MDQPTCRQDFPGVISVAATGVAGTLARLQQLSVRRIDSVRPAADTTLSAAGADLGDSNQGTTVPTTDSFVAHQGTSFSAPMVAGVASLMLAWPRSHAGAAPRDPQDDREALSRGLRLRDRPSAGRHRRCGAAVRAAKAAGGPAVDSGRRHRVLQRVARSLLHYLGAQEISDLDTGSGTRAGRAPPSASRLRDARRRGTSPVCRFYIPPAQGDSHFFGRGTAECNATAAAHPDLTWRIRPSCRCSCRQQACVRRTRPRLSRVQQPGGCQPPVHDRPRRSGSDGGARAGSTEGDGPRLRRDVRADVANPHRQEGDEQHPNGIRTWTTTRFTRCSPASASLQTIPVSASGRAMARQRRRDRVDQSRQRTGAGARRHRQCGRSRRGDRRGSDRGARLARRARAAARRGGAPLRQCCCASTRTRSARSSRSRTARSRPKATAKCRR